MSEHSILFSGEMVRAILEGRKTQTRRVVKPQPEYEGERSYGDSWAWRNGKDWFSGVTTEQLAGKHGLCYPGRSYGQTGDRLWVRESMHRSEDGEWHYSADCKVVTVPTAETEKVAALRVWAHHKDSPNCPSIHQPRWASRLTLEIANVRVERVQDISEADARDEGAGISLHEYPQWDGDPDCYRKLFRERWNKINEKRGFGWEVNPWVWVIEFRNLAAAGGNRQEPQK